MESLISQSRLLSISKGYILLNILYLSIVGNEWSEGKVQGLRTREQREKQSEKCNSVLMQIDITLYYAVSLVCYS